MVRRGRSSSSQGSLEGSRHPPHQVPPAVHGQEDPLEGDLALRTSGDGKEFLGESRRYRGEEYVFQRQFE